MPKRMSKKDADLGDQYWVRDGKAEHLAYLVNNAESRPGEVCIQWSDRRDREYVPKEAIMSSVVDDQQQKQGRDRRNRRRSQSVVENVVDRKTPSEKTSTKETNSGKEAKKNNTSKSNDRRDEMKKAAPGENRKPLAAKRRLSLKPPTSLKRRAIEDVKEVQVVKHQEKDIDDEISAITDEGCISHPKVEYSFKASKPLKKKWRLKSRTASIDKKQKREDSTRKSTKGNNTKKTTRLFRPSTSNFGSRDNHRRVEKTTKKEETSSDPFAFSETSPAIIVPSTMQQAESSITCQPLETPHVNNAQEQHLPQVTATKTTVQKRSVFQEWKQTVANQSNRSTTVNFGRNAVKQSMSEAFTSNKKMKLTDKENVPPSENVLEENLVKEDLNACCDNPDSFKEDRSTPMDASWKTERPAARNENSCSNTDKQSSDQQQKSQCQTVDFEQVSSASNKETNWSSKNQAGQLTACATISNNKDAVAKYESVISPQGSAKTKTPPMTSQSVKTRSCQRSPLAVERAQLNSSEGESQSMLRAKSADTCDKASRSLHYSPCVSNHEEQRQSSSEVPMQEEGEIKALVAVEDKGSTESPCKFNEESSLSAIAEIGHNKNRMFSVFPALRRSEEATPGSEKDAAVLPMSSTLQTSAECRQAARTIPRSTEKELRYPHIDVCNPEGTGTGTGTGTNWDTKTESHFYLERRDDDDDTGGSECDTTSIMSHKLGERPPKFDGGLSVYALAKSVYMESPGIDSADIIECVEDHLQFCLSSTVERKLKQYIAALSDSHATAARVQPVGGGNMSSNGPSITQERLVLSLDEGIAPVLQELQSKWLDEKIKDVIVTISSADTPFSPGGTSSLFGTIAVLPKVQSLTVAFGGRSLPVRDLMTVFKYGTKLQKVEINAVLFGQQKDFEITTDDDYNFSALRGLHLKTVGAISRDLQAWLLKLVSFAPLENIWLDDLQGISLSAIRKISQAPRLKSLGLRCVPVPQDILTSSRLQKIDLIDCSEISEALVSGRAFTKTLQNIFIWGRAEKEAAATFFGLLQSNNTMENVSFTVTGGASLCELGIDALLQSNKSLRQLDLVILGGIEHVEEGAICIAKALRRNCSMEAFRIFAGGQESELVSEALKIRMMKLLGMNKSVKTLRMFGFEWSAAAG